ncbi:MAG: DUF3237 domain-containing protein [Acidimicrobiales bacterium]
MELEALGTFTVTLATDRIHAVGDGPAGNRVVFEVDSGEFTGDRLVARTKGGACADWSITDGRGTVTLDVRAVLETDDGALIYVTYGGRADFSKGPGSAPLYGSMTFETGNDDYRWLNTVVAAIKGSFSDSRTIAYEVARLT